MINKKGRPKASPNNQIMRTSIPESIFKSSVTDLAKGQYPRIFGEVFPNLVQDTKHQPCPICGGKDRFRLFPDWQETGGAICNQCKAGNGFTWIMRAHDFSFPDACRMVEQILGIDQQSPDFERMAAQAKIRQAEQGAKRKAKIEAQKPERYRSYRAILNRAKPIQEVPAALQYLRNRGLGELIDREDLPPGLGAVDCLQYKEGDAVFKYPALVAPVLLNGQLVNVHRTYLDAAGHKAPISSPKKLMPSLYPGAMTGAVVPLYPSLAKIATLALAEGTETALSVRVAMPDLPVWATVSAHGLKSVQLPGKVCKVFIMGDLDASGAGQKAAYTLQQRLRKEGREAVVLLPDGPIPAGAKGVDWLDVLNSREVAA